MADYPKVDSELAPHYFNGQKSSDPLEKLREIHERRGEWSCLDFGPLEVCARHRNSGVDVEVKLLGIRVGRGRIDRNQATFSVGVNLWVAKASVTTRADFDKEELLAEGEVCRRSWNASWVCDRFSTVLLRW